MVMMDLIDKVIGLVFVQMVDIKDVIFMQNFEKDIFVGLVVNVDYVVGKYDMFVYVMM